MENKNEWKKVKLGDIGEIVSGGTPKTSVKEYWNGNISWLTPKDFSNKNYKYWNKGERNITKEGLKNSSAKLLPKGTVLFTSRAPIGYVGISDTNLCTNQGFKNIIVNEENSNEFIYYLLKFITPQIINIAGGSTFKEISATALRDFEVYIPKSKKYQEKIAKILSDIDAKIELNNKINNNLEEQIQVLFSKWLSNNFKFSNKVTLEEVCSKITDGSHFSPKDNSLSSIPMLSVKDMEKFDFNLKSCKHISETDYQKMLMNDCVPKINDILVAKDGSYLKEIFICNEERRIAILSSIAIFRPNLKKIYPEILLAFLKSPNLLKEVRDNYVSGSALPRIVLRDFKKLSFYLPSIEIQSEISSLFYSIRKQIAKNIMENEKLINLKNYLLPKLMNGEIDVKNIEL